MSQATEAVNPLQLPTMRRTVSTTRNLSKASRITDSMKKTSSKIDQKLEKLRSRMSKHKGVDKENEKPGSICDRQAEAVGEPTGEANPAIDVENINKDDVKKARQEARRAKWAARKASLKEFAKKAGKAVVISGAVILGIIVGPIIIVFDLAVSLLSVVIRLVVELLGLICAPFLICFV